VSAALPERQQKIRSATGVILFVTRLAIYAPVVVRESAPNTTPPSNSTAIIDVPIICSLPRSSGPSKLTFSSYIIVI